MCSAYDWYDYAAKLSKPRTPVLRERCNVVFGLFVGKMPIDALKRQDPDCSVEILDRGG
jgi:hypothetical protein